MAVVICLAANAYAIVVGTYCVKMAGERGAGGASTK